MDGCHISAKNKSISYERELADNCNEKKNLIHRHNRRILIALSGWEELRCTAQSRLIPDKSMLQNHYVEINIGRSHQCSRY